MTDKLTFITLLCGLALAFGGCSEKSEKAAPPEDSETASDPDTGVDTGEESDSEPTDTVEEHCFNGSFTIENALDVETLYPYTCVLGNLSVHAPGMMALDLPNLAEVDGDLIIAANNGFLNIDQMLQLKRVGGLFHIGSNVNLKTIDLPSLTHTGDLVLEDNPFVTSMNFPLLKKVTGELVLRNMASLVNLEDLNGIVEIEGALIIDGNEGLTSIDGLASNLSIGETVEESWEYPNMSLSIRGNANLSNLDGLSNLKSLGGGIIVDFNNELKSADLVSLDHIAWVAIYNNERLETVDFGGLLSGSMGGISILRNPRLSAMDFGEISTLAALQIESNDLLATLDSLETVIVVESMFYVGNNHSLPNCEVHALLTQLEAAPQETWVENNKADSCGEFHNYDTGTGDPGDDTGPTLDTDSCYGTDPCIDTCFGSTDPCIDTSSDTTTD